MRTASAPSPSPNKKKIAAQAPTATAENARRKNARKTAGEKDEFALFPCFFARYASALPFVETKLTRVRNRTVSSLASARTTEIQCRLFMW